MAVVVALFMRMFFSEFADGWYY